MDGPNMTATQMTSGDLVVLSGSDRCDNTLNGSSRPVNCHGDSNNPERTVVNNGSVSKENFTCSTVLRTSESSSPQHIMKPVSTVTLVRPPVQTATTNTLANRIEPMHSGVAMGTAANGRSPTIVQNMRTSAGSVGGIRAFNPQNVVARHPQAQRNTSIQLPPGMVLVRNENGQLLMIPHHALAQIQGQSPGTMTPRPVLPTSPAHITSLQTPNTSPLVHSIIPTQGSQAPTTTTLQRPPILQNTFMMGGAVQPTRQVPGATATVQPGSAASPVAQMVGAPPPIQVTAETLENVKKCRNFLSTLIKLASSGKQSPETIANVKKLVKNLLESKLEPEEFTSSLYKELNSPPQPYLVPFLKRSLPALRQMTPDSEAFIHQSLMPQSSTQPPAVTSTALNSVMLRPPLTTTAATNSAAAKTTVIRLTQNSNNKAGLIVAQQPRTMLRPQVPLAQSPVLVRGPPHSRVILSQQPAIKQLHSVPAMKSPAGARGVHLVGQGLHSTAANAKPKDPAAFKEDDDINDVAFMAGVNLLEENARILATNCVQVGAVTRSCKDEAFLSMNILTRKVLEIGKRFGVSEVGSDVINFISHGAQHRLQNLLEMVSHVAQQRNITFKEDELHVQSGDVRAQLKFFEQLDQIEKQKKEDQEREILLKVAKSRSRQEDPEQLRLKQKAREMQQQEQAQIQQREANQTALAAIGPRKKRLIDSPFRGFSAEGAGSSPSQRDSPGGGASRQFMRQRITRVNLKDLLFCLENERVTRHSHLLYKGFLK